MDKKKLRKEILAYRDALSQKERYEKSAQIANKVIELESFQEANKILLYAHMRSEVETTDIYQAAKQLGKTIYYPRVIGDKMEFYLMDEKMEFETSAFGVAEPKMEEAKQFVPREKDKIFILMPGVVFDERGNRIGYGGGYYDKYLEWLKDNILPEQLCTVAVAFNCQMVKHGIIKKEPHDISPNYVITESKICVIEREQCDGTIL